MSVQYEVGDFALLKDEMKRGQKRRKEKKNEKKGGNGGEGINKRKQTM